ncbi:MAG: SGNH/GDSL hydrolase family protein, partial [Ginsengibacter sp.]
MADRKKYTKYFYLTISLLFVAITISCSKKINATNVRPYTNPPSSNDTSINAHPFTDTSLKSYLALGDSYTIGQSVPAAERFPDQTIQLLRSENIKISDPEFTATTGWTTGNLISALNSNPPQNNYSLVSLLIGVNNQYRKGSVDEYKAEFALLLNRSIQYAGNNNKNVFVLSIPDYSATPFAHHLKNRENISNQIDSFNTINKEISDHLGVNYLDITSISREVSDDPELIAKDGLHPSGKQYKRWAELLAPMMKKS